MRSFAMGLPVADRRWRARAEHAAPWTRTAATTDHDAPDHLPDYGNRPSGQFFAPAQPQAYRMPNGCYTVITPSPLTQPPIFRQQFGR